MGDELVKKTLEASKDALSEAVPEAREIIEKTRSKLGREKLRFDLDSADALYEAFEEFREGVNEIVDEVRGKLETVFKGTFLEGLFGKKEEEKIEAKVENDSSSKRGKKEKRKIELMVGYEKLPVNKSLKLDFPSESTTLTSDIQHNRFIPALHKNPRDHNGVDIGMPVGTPIKSPGIGRVIYNRTTMSGSAGWYLDVEYNLNGKRKVMRFMHMKERSPFPPGALVKAGDVLGLSGATPPGKVTGPHLHFEVRNGGMPGNYGSAEDPYDYCPEHVRTAIGEDRLEKRGYGENDVFWTDRKSEDSDNDSATV